MEKTVVALFDNLDTAQTAVKELLNNGFHRDDVSVVRTNQQDNYTSGNMAENDVTENDASGAAAGAGIGAVLGGLAGLLVGLGALAIPGIGPIIAAGPLATTLAGAGIGAATGGLVGALADAGIPEHEAGAYAEGVRRGGTLVTVRADEDQVNRAADILNRFTPVDINQRAGEWQSSGWSGYDSGAGPYSTQTGAPHTRQAEDMPKGSYQAGMGMAAEGAAAESAASSPSAGGADRGQTSSDRDSDYRTQPGMTGDNSGGTYEGTGSAGYTGSGTIYKGGSSYTGNMDKPDTSDISGSPDRAGSSDWQDEDTVTPGDAVMRSGHGEMSTSTGFSGQGGGTYERMQDVDRDVHPRSSEGDYQARRDFLGSQGENEHKDNTDMIETGRGTYSNVGQAGEDSTAAAWQVGGGESRQFTGGSSGDDMGTTGMTFRSGPARRFDDYDREFQSDWQNNYGQTGIAYDRYRSAYQYGWQLADQYQGRQWNDFEASARTDWERSHPDDAWQDFKDAVRRGWERTQDVAHETGGSMSQGGQQASYGTQSQAMQQGGAGSSSGDARDNAERTYDRTMGTMSQGFETYDPDFRSDWDRSFRNSGYGYERFQPAYQYGYNLANDAQYRGREWSDVESSARRDWEQRHPNDAWEDFKGAVQHAWNRVRGGVKDTLD